MNELDGITDDLVRELAPLRFGPPVTHVYDPLVYAREAWDAYVRLAGTRPKEVLLLGMNPGPFGMAQTGVPFGDKTMARDWLGIELNPTCAALARTYLAYDAKTPR